MHCASAIFKVCIIQVNNLDCLCFTCYIHVHVVSNRECFYLFFVFSAQRKQRLETWCDSLVVSILSCHFSRKTARIANFSQLRQVRSPQTHTLYSTFLLTINSFLFRCHLEEFHHTGKRGAIQRLESDRATGQPAQRSTGRGTCDGVRVRLHFTRYMCHYDAIYENTV